VAHKNRDMWNAPDATVPDKSIPPAPEDPLNAFSPLHPDEWVKAPGPFRLALEARAPWEFATLMASLPWLRGVSAQGDGHPVLVLPGLGASDSTTLPLRNFLREQGWTPYAWEQGFNFGPRHGVLDRCRAQLMQIADRHGSAVSLVGWSLGGVYARELAKEQPAHARCVVTLGTPFAGHPRATNAWRFYELVSGQRVHDPALIEQIRSTPGCPTTSIYSKSDGVVAWQCSINPPSPRAENIEVQASHVGMGLNPLALYAVADRLAQTPGQWQRFEASGLKRWLYRPH
jgi:pimeloyl-ACP methyl ester carboxylesterase